MDHRINRHLCSHHRRYLLSTKYPPSHLVQSIYFFLTFSYVAELFVPIGALIIVRYSTLYTIGYTYIVLVFLYKIGCIVAIGAYAWYHAGLCYMQKSTNIVFIVINCFEMICLVVEILLLFRIKKVNR